MALKHGVPAVYQYSDFAEAGGIMSSRGAVSEPYAIDGNYMQDGFLMVKTQPPFRSSRRLPSN